MFSPYIYNPHLESIHMQLSVLLDSKSKDSWQCDRLKQKQTKSLWIYFHLKLFMILFAR